MSYFGTVLLTRSDTAMTRLPRIEAIGSRHRRLRDLGDGWQVLETSGWNDPPDLEQAVTEVAALWKASVFAAYVADCCAQLHGAVPDAVTWSGHLDDPADTDCGMLHRPPVRAGGTLEALEAQIINWAGAAGLTPSVPRLGRALRYRLQRRDSDDGPYLSADQQIFEVVRALGFPVLPEPRAYEFDPDDEPFAEVTAYMWGLASRARSAAAFRAHNGETEQPAAWEAEAIMLEMDVYAALYGGGRPLAELAARAAWVSAAHDAARRNTPPPPQEVMIQGRPVTNVHRIVHDLGPRQIADQVTFVQNHGKDMPNGSFFSDRITGPGIWPDLT